MRRFIQIMLFLFVFIFANEAYADKKVKIIKVTVEPKEAAIYINNTFSGYGYAEFTKPKKKNEVVIIRCECEEYKEVLTKFYGGDKRQSISLKLQQDGFYRSSASSGIVNKFFTIDIDKQYYTEKDGKVDLTPAWRLLHQILLNYFNEIEVADIFGGYLQTPWHYKSFTFSEKQIRNRVTIRDISTPDRVAFQIKLSSEVAGSMAAKHGEFTEIDRIPKELEPLIEELQTRIGKVRSL